MIVKNELAQYLQCSICGEVLELRRRTLADPETVMIMMQELEADHAPCEAYAHDPRRAALERSYQRNLKKALEESGNQRNQNGRSGRRSCRSRSEA